MNKQPSDAGSQPAGVVFEPITRTDGLPNKVRSQLLQMIAAGQLAPGDRLKPERELASELEVSRNVVREAIRSLVDANVLESRQGAGVFVASLHVESLIEPLGAGARAGEGDPSLASPRRGWRSSLGSQRSRRSMRPTRTSRRWRR